MWNHHFPNNKIERIFNWAPKAWRGLTPTFTLTEQTNSKSIAKLPHLVALASIENDVNERSVYIKDGIIDIDKGLERNISEILLSDLVRKRKQEKEAPKP